MPSVFVLFRLYSDERRLTFQFIAGVLYVLTILGLILSSFRLINPSGLFSTVGPIIGGTMLLGWVFFLMWLQTLNTALVKPSEIKHIPERFQYLVDRLKKSEKPLRWKDVHLAYSMEEINARREREKVEHKAYAQKQIKERK